MYRHLRWLTIFLRATAGFGAFLPAEPRSPSRSSTFLRRPLFGSRFQRPPPLSPPRIRFFFASPPPPPGIRFFFARRCFRRFGLPLSSFASTAAFAVSAFCFLLRVRQPPLSPLRLPLSFFASAAAFTASASAFFFVRRRFFCAASASAFLRVCRRAKPRFFGLLLLLLRQFLPLLQPAFAALSR